MFLVGMYILTNLIPIALNRTMLFIDIILRIITYEYICMYFIQGQVYSCEYMKHRVYSCIIIY